VSYMYTSHGTLMDESCCIYVHEYKYVYYVYIFMFIYIYISYVYTYIYTQMSECESCHICMKVRKHSWMSRIIYIHEYTYV